MSCSETHFASLNLVDYTFPQIERQVNKSPFLILPVGGIEPVGPSLALGVINIVTERFAAALSEHFSVITAPLVPIGSTIPFKAFGGSAGVHRDFLVNFLMDCCNCWFFQGFKRIIILSLSMDAMEWGREVAKRFSGENTGVRLMTLQEDERFRRLCHVYENSGASAGRSEWGIAALAAYLCPDSVRVLSPDEDRSSPRSLPESFRQWHRRGKDPEKMRKLFPDALFSESPGELPDETTGKLLFASTLQLLIDDVTPFFTVEDNASR
ncbi:MAG: creatininase family protein [Chitinispirillaceae bacterium]|nr:creatininase family protein [Chitinispirillaceae bacterium]